MASRWICRWDRETESLKLIPVGDYVPKARVHVIQDSMNATVHPCTGKPVDSKSEFRKITRANGCVEMGNDAPTTVREKPITGVKESLLRSWEQLSR